MGTVFRSGSFDFGTSIVRILQFNLHFPQRPFSGTGYCSKKTKKAVLPVIGERLRKGC